MASSTDDCTFVAASRWCRDRLNTDALPCLHRQYPRYTMKIVAPVKTNCCRCLAHSYSASLVWCYVWVCGRAGGTCYEQNTAVEADVLFVFLGLGTLVLSGGAPAYDSALMRAKTWKRYYQRSCRKIKTGLPGNR